MRLCILAIVMLLGIGTSPAQRSSGASELAQTELSFSNSATARGINPAFLAYFGDDGIMFLPLPVNARNALSTDPGTPGSLVWRPTRVLVSASNDIGFSTGPSEYRPAGSDTTSHFAHFFSIWKRDRVGDWKVLLDIGNRYPAGEQKGEEAIFSDLPPGRQTHGADLEARRAQMFAADSIYSATVVTNGTMSAVERYADAKVRAYRNRRFPAEGKDSVMTLIRGEKFDRAAFTAGQCASAGDLGFTYGLAVGQAADTSNYVRVWVWNGEWKLAVDLVSPLKR